MPLPDARPNQPYSHQIGVTGGVPPYFFMLTSGSLPPGSSMSDTGLITGNPTCTQGVSFPFTVAFSDNTGAGCEKQFSITCNAVDCSAWVWTASPLPVFDQGQLYSKQLTISGGTAPYTFSLASGALPQGLSLSTSGLISGVAALVNGNLDASFTVKAIDALANECSKAFSLPVMDYNDFPTGKHWRIKGYTIIDASCCTLGVANVWQGEFNGKVHDALFKEVTGSEAIGGNRLTFLFLEGRDFLGPHAWKIMLRDFFFNPDAAWWGTKVGSNAGSKLDSPAGVYTLDLADAASHGITTVCDHTPTFEIEEY